MEARQKYEAAASAVSFGEHRDHPRKGSHTNDLSHNDPLFHKRAAPLNPSNQYAHFVITPPARSDYLSEETPFVTVEDVQEYAEQVKGLPFINNHTAGEVFGRVVDTTVDGEKRIVAKVQFEDTLEGWKACDQIRSGKKMGVSLGQIFATQDTKYMSTAVTKKVPRELSLTAEPEFDEHTWVIEMTENSDEHERIKKDMTEADPDKGEEDHPHEKAILEFHGRSSLRPR